MRRHPKIAFNVMTGGEEALHVALEDRKIELVMTAVSGALPDWIVTETLFNDSLIVAAGPQNPWTRRRKTELAELMNERWVLLPPDRPAGALIVEVFRACGLEVPASSFITASLNLRNRLIATGRFLTMQSRYTVAPRSNYPLLKELPVKLPNTQRTVSILTAKKRTISPVAELFMRTARESFKRLDD